MPESIPEKLDKGYRLIYEGRMEKVLQFVKELEKEEDLTQEDSLRCQIFKGIVLFYELKFEKALKVFEQALAKSKNLGNISLTIEVIFWDWSMRVNSGIPPKSREIIMHLENLLKSIKEYPTSEIEKSEFFIQSIKNFINTDKGEFDRVLEDLRDMENYLKTIEQNNGYMFLSSKPFLIGHFANIYALKGELELALKYHNMNLELLKGTNIGLFIALRAFSLSQMGDIYYQQGDFNLAIEYYKKSLKIREQLNIRGYLVEIYYRFIKIYLMENNREVAQEYLTRFQEHLEREKIPNDVALEYPLYKLSKVLILKSNKRIRDRVEAEKYLKELIEHYANLKKMEVPIPWGVVTNSGTSRYSITPIIELCDLYIQELDMIKNLEILDEIRPLIERLLDESERTNSFSLQAYAFLIKGKISLLQMNIGEARQYITQAQRIAEEHDFQTLAHQISNEHDSLLELLDELNQLKKKKVSISERLGLASLDITIDQLQGKRSLEPPELTNEEPILLMILGSDGVSYFNYPFAENWNFNDIFSSFMSAFNSFSDEIFSESIDRIKIGDNVILIKPIESFLICYVIKGQSYSALQKLSRFSDAIKWNTEISEALKKAIKTGEELELSNPASLGVVVNEIFSE